jgi:succinyl-CoA synthetase beta subunit
MAVDAKLILMIMIYRQKAYADMRDSLRKPIEVEAKEVSELCDLDGTVGCMVAGVNGNYGFN